MSRKAIAERLVIATLLLFMITGVYTVAGFEGAVLGGLFSLVIGQAEVLQRVTEIRDEMVN